jgi:hypothetical protein
MTRIRPRRGTSADRQKILRSRDHFWTPDDLGGAESTRQHLLAALVRAGELRRISRGLYWRGTPTPLGMSPPSPAALLARIAPGHGSGPASLSAANALRLSTQIPRKMLVAVPTRPPRSTDAIEFLDRRTRTGRVAAKLGATEVALLEMLDDPSASELNPHETWERLRDLLKSEAVRPQLLARAAETEPARVRERLGQLLRESGFDNPAASIRSADPRVRSRILSGLPSAAASRHAVSQ